MQPEIRPQDPLRHPDAPEYDHLRPFVGSEKVDVDLIRADVLMLADLNQFIPVLTEKLKAIQT